MATKEPVKSTHVQKPSSQQVVDYHSNPFEMSLQTLKTVFAHNGIVSLLLGIWLFVGGFGLYVASLVLGLLSPLLTVIGIVATILWFVAWWAAHIALVLASFQGKQGTSQEFISQARHFLPQLVGLGILSFLLILVGFVLLIVPGLIFLAWFSLAPYAMIAEDLGPVASLKRSRQLVKGHIFEIYGAMFAGGLLSGQGLLGIIVSVASLGGRYAEIKALKESNTAKPKTHWLNFIAPVVLLLFIVLFVTLIAISARTSSRHNNSYQNQFEINTSDSYQSR